MTIPAVLPVYKRADVAIERGEGPYVYTTDGTKLLDFVAGIAVASLGHCHPALNKALRDQSEKIWITSNLYQIPEQEELAKKITDATFADSVFFTNSGTEAVELAIKMVRKYFHAKGQPDKHRIITIEGSFHGRTYASISAAGSKKLIDGFAPLLEGFDHIPFGDHDALKAAIGPNTAAIMLEPVLGEGGMRPIPDQCMQGLRELCDENDMLLVFDEVQCGAGRTGKLFAHEWSGIAPDIMAIAKGIGGGFPLGATVATEDVAKAMNLGSHGTTYGGNPLAMAVGNAVFDHITDPKLLKNVEEMGEYFMNRLNQLAAQYPKHVVEIRGKGLMLGLKMKEDPATSGFIDTVRANGLLTAPAGDNVARFVPPLNIDKNHVDEAVSALEKSLRSL